MLKNIHSIAVMDSGIGGLSILKSILAHNPAYSFTYLADHKYYPYGCKSENELIERLTTLIPKITKDYPCKVIVMACNTASTTVLEKARKMSPVPIIGVVPAIKPAAKLSQSKVIGVLATPITTRSEYTKKLIETFASDCKVVMVSSSKLVGLAEAKILGKKILKEELITELNPLLNEKKLDTLVLACTHFPFLREEISQILPDSVHIIDSGTAIANRLENILPAEQIQNKSSNLFLLSSLKYYTLEKAQQVFSKIAPIQECKLYQS